MAQQRIPGRSGRTYQNYSNKSSKKNGDAILLYAQNLLHSLYKMGDCEFVDQELSVAIFGHNS